MKFSTRQYTRFDPFEGERDIDIRARTVALVTVRKEHPCFEGLNPDNDGPHTIKPGEKARYETAVVDGRWGRWYVCIACMDKWLTTVGVVPE